MCAVSSLVLKLNQLPFKLSSLTLGCLIATFLQPAIGLAGEAVINPQDENIERISVKARPIRNSQEQSIQLQRDATNVVNVIASEDIGRFPDQTAAAALARLPAVAVQRDQGQERYIQVRGAPARWTVVAFDGINVLGAEERVFRFDSVPANLMSEVEVAKTLTAQMPAEALAGRVNIKTFSPLRQPGLNGELDVGFGKNQLGGGDQQRFAGRASWSNGIFGAMAAVSRYANEQITDNNETSYDNTGAPERFDFRNYLLTRKTNSAAVKFEYAPSNDSKYTLSSLYTEFIDHEQRNQFIFDLSRGKGKRSELDGSLVGVPVTAMYQEGDYENSTWVNTLSGEHFKGDWRWNWAINYTETESSIHLPILRRSQTNPSEFYALDYSMSNPQSPMLNLYRTHLAEQGMVKGPAVHLLKQDGFGFDGLIMYGGLNTTEAITFKFDTEKAWQHSAADAKLAFGVQLDNRDADSPGTGFPFIPLGPLAETAGLNFTPDSFNTNAPWQSGQYYGFAVNYFDNVAARQQLDQVLHQLISSGVIQPETFVSKNSGYQVQENIFNAYLMNTWTWNIHQLVVGARTERVNLSSAGFMTSEKGLQAIARENDTTDIFPSIHWNVDLSENVKFRLAGVTGASRPSFSEVRAGASISDADRAIRGGNPDLKSETARGIDSSLEWYFADASLAAINVFYRDLDKVLFSSSTIVSDDRFNTEAFDRVGYEYNTMLNGGTGHFAGVEFTYIQPWDFLPERFSGFGMQFNYAFLDSEFSTPDGRKVALPGTSNRVLNTTFFYENFGWSIRLNYQWRDAWLDDISYEATGDIYWQDTARLDLSLRYQLSENISVYADLNNLTDELGVRFRGDKSKPIEVEAFGRRFLTGVKVSF